MFRYVFLAAGLFYAQSAIACPMADAAAFAEAAAKVAQVEGTKATYKIEGMTCGSCSEKVATVVNAVEGVLLSAVDYQTGRIEIAFDSQKTNLAKLEAALAGTGHKITEKPQA